MKFFQSAIRYTKRPLSLFDRWAKKGRLNWLPDKIYLSLMWRSKMGYWLNWANPQGFNEKMQWLKLNYRQPSFSKQADKYEVRSFVENKIGKQYLIPILGVWDDPDKIDFSKLPNQFVLKCNHDSGSVVVCHDKSKIDENQIKSRFKESLKKNYYYRFREWPYKDIKPLVIAEQFLQGSEKDEVPYDYKFFCFHGEPKFMYISNDGAQDTVTDFFDMDYNHLECVIDQPNASVPPAKPEKFDEMVSLAKKLSEGIPHVRVDFFCCNNQVYFGEMTFFHDAGFFKFTPSKWDNFFGEMLDLKSIGKKH
ncbi:ATP-grasp fold amidoligase family protein [Fibrobacter sp. UWB10]|uniref:ATP-grasp fold amidoligase family protein n=1 Tax=Fibrobacter sp. UWB10 TaxID=1896201 RepID=UPI0024034304|nr:ATP-grasp fold amidoligase family protein [Fibrobacter sp. UWB10]SMP56657.1 TupA-like ATPgrasp [Fibrobacter sp. UWB10]